MHLTPKELATLRGVKPQTVINWAKDGYPLDTGEKVPLPGADKSGRKWIFDKTKVLRFFEKLKEERWREFTDLHIKTRKPERSRSLKYGTIDSSLTVKASGELLLREAGLLP